MIEESEAVVLHTMKYGDTSKIVTLYSRKFGKIKVIAKGARRAAGGKFGSSLEPLTYSSVVFYRKELRDLHLLSKSEIKEPLVRLQDDAERMASALAVAELVSMVMHDEERNDRLFLLLVEALRTINAAAKQALNVFFSFELKLFVDFGFGIAVDRCVRCRRPFEGREVPFALLRLSDGAIVCADCAAEASGSGMRLSGGLLRSLSFLQTTDIPSACLLQLSPSVRDEMHALLHAYLRYHIEGTRTIRSFSLFMSHRQQ